MKSRNCPFSMKIGYRWYATVSYTHLMQLLFEVVSAFGTVGLSTRITPELSIAGKGVIILVMFIGRVGIITLLSMWVSRTEPRARYSEEEVAIG